MAGEILIGDGKGANGPMSVSDSRRGNVSAKTNPRIFYSSRDDEKAYNAIMDNNYSATAGDYVFYFQNRAFTIGKLIFNRLHRKIYCQ